MELKRAALCLLGAAACGAPETERPNVVLIVVDTLRADALGAYGSTFGDTPRLDEFARRSIVFPNSSTPRAKTNPAVASLFTGTYPPEHGVRDLNRPLPETLPTLAEAFRAAGWRTTAIVGNYVLSRERSRLDRGFERWIEEFPDVSGAPGVPERRAASLVDEALAQLDSFGDERFLLALHFMDPHGPYEPPLAHRVTPGAAELLKAPSAAQPWQTPTVAQINVPDEARGPGGAIDVAVVRAGYRGEVRSMDTELGRLFDALEQRDLTRNTIVVVTADHGESFGEHAYWFEHGLHAYEATCSVPLILCAPGQTPIVEDLAAPRSIVDIAPTLLDLCGIDATLGNGAIRGRNLFEPGLVPTYSEKAEGNRFARAMQIDAVRIGTWKLVRRFAYREEGERAPQTLVEELYDLASDPHESRNLVESPGAAPLADLRRALVEWRAFDDGHVDAPEREPNPNELERLRAMGYVGR